MSACLALGFTFEPTDILAQAAPTRAPAPLPVAPIATPTRSLAPTTGTPPTPTSSLPRATATATATPAPAVSAAQLPRFVLGFAFLKDQLGPIMGVPLEAEHGAADSCDTRQRTSTGLAYWRCGINAMAFAAGPDGLQHWAWTGHLVSWVGSSPDPPADARAVVPLIVTTGTPNASCTTPAEGPIAACALAAGVTLPGYIQDLGQTNAYRFTVPAPTTHMAAQLTDLPADYDLYLTDANGVLLDESVNEGTTPEEIDMTLSPGVYYLYVHDDPSRPVDGSSPYQIHLDLAP